MPDFFVPGFFLKNVLIYLSTTLTNSKQPICKAEYEMKYLT
jgi:hypothetical protein